MKQRISQPAFDLIVRFETGGKEYYDKFLKHPSYPGGASGVTIGFGYDLGYESHLESDWSQFLSSDDIQRLTRYVGYTGSRAKQAISAVRDIIVPWEQAQEVFNECTLPQEIRNTLRVFPSSADKLPADAFGALVSLVFNRGTDLDGDRRIEMRQIRSAIDTGNPGPLLLQRIAAELRKMKRLWHNNPDSDGDLVDRREAEAKLVEDSKYSTTPA